jgi:uncharacterized protein
MQVTVNYFRSVLLMVFMMLANSIHAGNTQENSVLTIPEDFNVLYVDGQKTQSSFFSPGGAELKLAPGEHRVVMIYDQFFESGDDTNRIKSAPFMLSFVIEQTADVELQFTAPKTLDAAREFAKNPQVELHKISSQSALPLQITLNIDKDWYLASYAKPPVQPLPPVQPSPAPVVQVSFPPNPAPAEKAGKQSNALQQLQYWWQQADDSQREEFLQGIKARP